MPFFKKREKTKKNSKKNKTIKKKTKIGIKHKNKNKKKKQKETKNQENIYEEITPSDDNKNEKKEKKQNKNVKKKSFLNKDMKGKPVFLEDTGEKLGTVFETIFDENKNILGYKIKDRETDAVLSFTVDNFDYNKDGLIFIPGWYNNALSIIEKLEFKDKISPELTALLSDDQVTNEELYDIFVKHDSEMVNYIDDSKSLREMLTSRLKVLQKQRISLKDELMDLTEKRLIKDIDRKEFSEDVMNHRRKVNILDLNIKKCKDLIKRLDNTSFGVLGKSDLIEKNPIQNNLKNNLTENILNSNLTERNTNNYTNKNDEYKNKYFELKERYSELEQDYRELKIAVDELVKKENI